MSAKSPVPSPKPRSVKDLEGRLRYDGTPKTLDELDAGIAHGAAESLDSHNADNAHYVK
ncbi:hypothetical protein [Jiangella rhizosphaerae]|uniref:hypothetical protein n=1 Tax=Jiangella rhizosphaerae TaxID=2293569 RepID=UPI001314940F|nr:hypothetical protein [Jiangella rhizosphaerae]